MSNLSNEARELLAELNKVTDQVKNIADDARVAAQKSTEISAASKKAADDALTAQGEIRAQLVELQQHMASQLPAGESAPQTLGAKFVAEESVKNYLAAVAQGREGREGIKASFIGESLRNDISGNTTAAGGALRTPQYVPGIIPPGMQRLTIRDLLMWGSTSQNAITYFKELAFTNNAAPVSELVTKPESNITFQSASANVITIAHWIKASKQILSDVPALQSYIDGRLRYGLKLKEEAQLLTGSGSGNNLQGLYTAASSYSNPGVTVESENQMDRLRLAILQAELSGYYADGIVLSPVDWTAIELRKTASDKNYLVGNPFGTLTPTLWARPVVASQSMTAGNYLTGAFGMAAQGWDREQMSVQIGYEGTDFIDNALTLLCEERLALAIYRADAMIKGSFGSVD